MKKYSYLKAIYLSFFSKDLYRDVLQNWKGLGFRYLLLISFVLSFIMCINLLKTINSFDIEKFADEATYNFFESPDLTFEQNLNRVLDIISQIPKLKFENNELSLDEEEPYFITDPVSKKDLIIFDSTGEYNSLEGTGAAVLLTRDRIVTKKEEGVEQVDYISKIESGSEENLNDLFSFVSQIPKITISDGIASIKEETPYYILGKEEKPYVVIDTNSESDVFPDEDTILLITKDKIILKDILNKGSDDSAIRYIYISEITPNLIYSSLKELLVKMLSISNWAILIIALPVFTIGSFLSSLITILIYGIITLSISKFLKIEDLEYERAVRLSAVAATPVFFIKAFLPEILPSQWLIYFIISIGYLYFAVSANVQNINKNEAS